MAEVIHSLPGRQNYLQVQLMQEIKAGGGPINFVLKSGFFFLQQEIQLVTCLKSKAAGEVLFRIAS